MTETFCDVPFATQSPAQKLDIYLPDEFSGTLPVIVWFHPGGFNHGDKDGVQAFVPVILARGYAVVSVNYRLAGDAMFPAQIFDAKAAVRWVRANAAKYRFHPYKIASWGISAGSTLAALLGTTSGVEALEDLSMGNASESSRVNAVVSWYGPMDLIALGEAPDPENSGEVQMMGGRISQVPEKYKTASPITYVNRECPPFYIQHGTTDKVIPLSQSITFAGALEKVIGRDNVKLKLIPNAGHFDLVQSSSENINEAVDFLDRYFS
jgi:acetyl esterase/lipase